MQRIKTAGLKFIGAGYCLVKSDWPKVIRLSRESAQLSRAGGKRALMASLFSPFRYGTTPEEYFLLSYYDLPHHERKCWVGTVDMWLAQRRFVPASVRRHFADKEQFNRVYQTLMDGSARLYTDKDDPVAFVKTLEGSGFDYFVKPADGQCGSGASALTAEAIRKEGTRALERATAGGGKYIVERRLVNHPDIQRISPEGLSTVRVVTAVTAAGEIELLFARARFANGKMVDNLGSGGLAVPIDLETGVIDGPAITTSTLIDRVFERHPKTDVVFQGRQIPMWERVLDLAIRSARLEPRARVIGWDIAVTPEGPILIEGNHNWGKVLWQLPVNTGMAQELARVKALVALPETAAAA